MGNSLRPRSGGIRSIHDIVRKLPCENPFCDMQLSKIRHDLDLANLRVYYLEKQLVENGIWKAPNAG